MFKNNMELLWEEKIFVIMTDVQRQGLNGATV